MNWSQFATSLIVCIPYQATYLFVPKHYSQSIYHIQLLFSMTYSLCFLLILSHQIRRWGKFRKHIIDGINLPQHLQQEEKSRKRKIARCSILKLVDGGQTKPRKLGNLFLSEIASHSIFLESYSQQAYQTLE